MYAGYVFVCDKQSLNDCIRENLLACSRDAMMSVEEVEEDSVVFLLTTDSNTLIGPFTATGSRKTGLQPGAWEEVTDEHDASENIRVKWENLHELKNPEGKFPFLKDIKTCRLTQLQTQEMLDSLEKAPLFNMKQSHRSSARR